MKKTLFFFTILCGAVLANAQLKLELTLPISTIDIDYSHYFAYYSLDVEDNYISKSEKIGENQSKIHFYSVMDGTEKVVVINESVDGDDIYFATKGFWSSDNKLCFFVSTKNGLCLYNEDGIKLQEFGLSFLVFQTENGYRFVSDEPNNNVTKIYSLPEQQSGVQVPKLQVRKNNKYLKGDKVIISTEANHYDVLGNMIE